MCNPIEEEGALLTLLKIITRSVSVLEDLHIDLIVRLGFIPKLIDMLNINDNNVRNEIALIVINLTACESNCVELIKNLNGHKKLIELIDSSNISLVERCLWALGNIAGDKNTLRELLLSTELPIKISILLSKDIPLSLRRIACWVASHLCQGSLQYTKVLPMLQPLNSCLNQLDLQVLSDTLKALSSIIQDKFMRGELARQLNIRRILELMLCKQHEVSLPATYVIGYLCSGDHICTSLVIENEGVKVLCFVLQDTSVNLHTTKYACWALANLSLIYAADLALNHDLIKRIVQLITTSSDYSVFFL